MFEFQPITPTRGEFEFARLAEMNRRVIAEAFQMRPDELPSYSSSSRSLLSSSDVGVCTWAEFDI